LPNTGDPSIKPARSLGGISLEMKHAEAVQVWAWAAANVGKLGCNYAPKKPS